MTIAQAIIERYPGLNDVQRDIVGHVDGPLLVIAGPGSGKTFSIVLRALNLLLLGRALPRQIVLCTFTQKAAFEMRDRLAAAVGKVGYTGDLSELTASTIHSLCNRILSQHRHRTELGHGYDTIVQLGRRFGAPHPLAAALSRWVTEIAGLKEGDALDLRPADYFYHFLALEPFKSSIRNENTARNLAIFSQLVNVFQSYYHYTVVTHRNREFLRLLFDGGINEYGLLVHQTIEEIHRIAMDGKLGTLDQSSIRELFERTFRFLCLSDVRPIGDAAKESAFAQVLNYWCQNREEMRRVIQTELDVSLEKDGYILAGKVDLLLGGDGKLELLDFKTSPRPRSSPGLVDAYERQLCTYAHILECRHGKRVDRLLLYWTAEARKQVALMVLPYDPTRVEEAGRHFDETVRCIQAREFAVTTPPEPGICKECDLRMLCHSEGVISREGRG